MRWSLFVIFFLLNNAAVGQALKELERQLDSLLNERKKSELIIGVGYGNNPAYSEKRLRFEQSLELKPFVSPSLTYYHKSGFFASVSNYYLFNGSKQPWFEWDFSVGYDYTEHDDFLAGISYTRYLYADSANIPLTPILNEAFAYFYYRKWWLQPGVSVDMGWGRDKDVIGPFDHRLKGYDFNVIAVLRHPFIFLDVLRKKDALLMTPSLGLTMGTAAYDSHLMRRAGIAAMEQCDKNPDANNGGAPPINIPNEFTIHAFSAFAPRAVDVTMSVSYVVGPFTFNPSYTLYSPLGMDQGLAGYFSARIFYTLLSGGKLQ